MKVRELIKLIDYPHLQEFPINIKVIDYHRRNCDIETVYIAANTCVTIIPETDIRMDED